MGVSGCGTFGSPDLIFAPLMLVFGWRYDRVVFLTRAYWLVRRSVLRVGVTFVLKQGSRMPWLSISGAKMDFSRAKL